MTRPDVTEALCKAEEIHRIAKRWLNGSDPDASGVMMLIEADAASIAASLAAPAAEPQSSEPLRDSVTQEGEPSTEAGPPFCPRCGHADHDDRDDPRCSEIVAVHGPDNLSEISYEPEYCGCADVDALYVRMRQAEARASAPAAEPAVTEALRRAGDELAAIAEAALLQDAVDRDLTNAAIHEWQRLASSSPAVTARLEWGAQVMHATRRAVFAHPASLDECTCREDTASLSAASPQSPEPTASPGDSDG